MDGWSVKLKIKYNIFSNYKYRYAGGSERAFFRWSTKNFPLHISKILKFLYSKSSDFRWSPGFTGFTCSDPPAYLCQWILNYSPDLPIIDSVNAWIFSGEDFFLGNIFSWGAFFWGAFWGGAFFSGEDFVLGSIFWRAFFGEHLAGSIFPGASGSTPFGNTPLQVLTYSAQMPD